MGATRPTLLVATVVFAALVAAGGATAHPDVATASGLRGTVVAALRPSAGAVSTVRAIDAQTGTAAARGRVGAGGAYRLATPPGVYLVVVDKVSRRAPFVTGYGRLVRVLPGKTAVVRTIAPGSATRTTAALLAGGLAPASIDAAAAPRPAIAIQNFTGSGPQAHLGRGLAAMLGTDLWGSPCYDVVEWARRSDLLAEIRLQQSKWVDPATRVTPRLIQPKVLVEGSVSSTASSVSWNLRIRERATGRVIGGDRGSTAGSIFTAELALAKRLRKLLEEALCGDRYTGRFTGHTRESAGGQTVEMTFSGTVTFMRSSPAGVPTPFRSYTIEKIDWSTTVTLSGRCRGTGTESASLRNDRSPGNMLAIATAATPGKGRLYRLNFNVHRPTSSTFSAACEGGVTIQYPWSPLAQVVTAAAPFYTDAAATRLRGSYTVPGTPISYTWDLAKGR